MSWTRKEKRERNQRLIDYAREHPEATHKTLAGIFHLSRSRVSRILKDSPQLPALLTNHPSQAIPQTHQDGFLSHLWHKVRVFFTKGRRAV